MLFITRPIAGSSRMVFGPCALTRRSGEKRKHDYGPQEKLSGQAQDAGPKDPQRLQITLERTPLMTRDELLAKLKELKEMNDLEMSHLMADEALLNYIADEEIAQAFCDLERWYA